MSLMSTETAPEMLSLYDPRRPCWYSTTRPAWASGLAIEAPRIMPGRDGGYTISAFLPASVHGSRCAHIFVGSIRDGEALIDFLTSFAGDPEGTYEIFFGHFYDPSVIRPELRDPPPNRGRLATPTPIRSAGAGSIASHAPVVSADDFEL